MPDLSFLDPDPSNQRPLTWQIDHLLIDRYQLKSNWIRTFEPHQGYFRERIKGTTREERTLLNLPDSVGVLVQERLHLVSRDELEGLVESGLDH